MPSLHTIVILSGQPKSVLYFTSNCSAGFSCETKVHYIARHALSMSIVDCAFFAGGTVDGFTARVFRQSNVQIDRLEPGPRPHGLGFPVQCSAQHCQCFLGLAKENIPKSLCGGEDLSGDHNCFKTSQRP